MINEIRNRVLEYLKESSFDVELQDELSLLVRKVCKGDVINIYLNFYEEDGVVKVDLEGWDFLTVSKEHWLILEQQFNDIFNSYTMVERLIIDKVFDQVIIKAGAVLYPETCGKTCQLMVEHMVNVAKKVKPEIIKLIGCEQNYEIHIKELRV